MRVVVTGGTGFVGASLSAALAARGDEVTVLTRGAPRALGERVTAALWTPTAPGEWQRVVEEADAVVTLSGAGVMDERWTPSRMEELHTSRITPTRLVAEALARARGAGRAPVLVATSAVGIYGMREDDAPLAESAPHGEDVLARLCEEWEAAAAPARDAGVRVAVARLGVVLGPGGALARMVPPFRAFVGGPLGKGTQIVSWIHLADAVRALVFAIDTAGFAGPFNVTAPHAASMNELSAAIGAALGRPSRVRAPAFALRAALGARADVLLTGQRVIPSALHAAGFRFSFEHVGDALADILAAG